MALAILARQLLIKLLIAEEEVASGILGRKLFGKLFKNLVEKTLIMKF